MDMRVVLLGTGTPNAEPDRSGPSVAVVVGDDSYLVDFGPGVVRRAAGAAHLRGINALRPENLKNAFLTHLHSDHTAGYPDLILTPWVLGRRSPLEVFGPPGIDSMTRNILKAYGEDIKVRIEGKENANEIGWKVKTHEIKDGKVYQDENITVRAFPVEHGTFDHAFGFEFESKDRSVVISGDTRPCPALERICRGCDLLIHEVYSHRYFQGRSLRWRDYHSSFHTSSMELGEIASKARPGMLVLYHQLLWGSSPEDLVEEVRSVYDGEVIYGRDLDVF
jgi:ribonuclease BN (tRNA processing enzyme)